MLSANTLMQLHILIVMRRKNFSAVEAVETNQVHVLISAPCLRF